MKESIKWKKVKVDAKQLEAIEPLVDLYGFQNASDFITKAIYFYMNYLKQYLGHQS